jgi:hypothetical protein
MVQSKSTLNFDKTHYIHFVTKKDKSAKLMIGYNNKFVACSFVLG